MTAPVIDLESHRRNRAQAVTCRACSRDQLCYPHRLEALAARLRASSEGVMLVPVSTVVDALAVLDGITSVCLTEDERPAR